MKHPPILRFAMERAETRLEKLRQELKRAARHPDDADAIHDLRVSIRRFTQCLRTFRQFFDRKRTKKVRKRLKEIMDLCGAVRNCDIALELLADAGLPASSSLYKSVRARRTRAERELSKTLANVKKRRVERSAIAPVDPRNSEGRWNPPLSVSGNAKSVLPELAGEFFETGDAASVPGVPYEDVHRFRLRAKRFRYTVELFRKQYGTALEEGLAALRGLQDRLGAINDCVTTRELITREPPAVKLVDKLLACREAAFREFWEQEFGKEKRTWWNGWLRRPLRSAGKGENTNHGDLPAAARRSSTAPGRARRQGSKADR